VAAPNRVGLEKLAGEGIEFWGQSFVAGPSGEILARASADREEVLMVPVDLGEVETARTHWPFLRDRRIDAYGEITNRFNGPPAETQPVTARATRRRAGSRAKSGR
jgi:N-carbamoylputrescine amidase